MLGIEHHFSRDFDAYENSYHMNTTTTKNNLKTLHDLNHSAVSICFYSNQTHFMIFDLVKNLSCIFEFQDQLHTHGT